MSPALAVVWLVHIENEGSLSLKCSGCSKELLHVQSVRLEMSDLTLPHPQVCLEKGAIRNRR